MLKFEKKSVAKRLMLTKSRALQVYTKFEIFFQSCYIFESNVLFLRKVPGNCTKKNAWKGTLNVSAMLLVAVLA